LCTRCSLNPQTQLLVSFLLHCADLCNPLLPPALSMRIANTLGREFDSQAEAERAAGLPVTVMLAHDTGSKAKMEVREPARARARVCVPHVECVLLLHVSDV
jgi:hypothetical protein